jgi:transposase
VLPDYIHCVHDAEARVDQLTRQIAELAPGWSMAPVVAVLQAMRGIAFLVAITVAAELDNFSLRESRQLTAYLVSARTEHSSGA